jgi:hypothetical protein
MTRTPPAAARSTKRSIDRCRPGQPPNNLRAVRDISIGGKIRTSLSLRNSPEVALARGARSSSVRTLRQQVSRSNHYDPRDDESNREKKRRRVKILIADRRFFVRIN